MQVAVCSALGIDSAWALESFELTPYKFNLLESLALRMDDPDVALCKVLGRGAANGVTRWAEACDLFWCTSNHISAEQEPAKVRALVQKEVDLFGTHCRGDVGSTTAIPGWFLGNWQAGARDVRWKRRPAHWRLPRQRGEPGGQIP